MIDNVLMQLSQRLNEHFRNSDPRAEDWVILSNLVDHGGRVAEDTRDKIVLSLAAIHNETVVGTYKRAVPAGDGFVAVAPPLFITLQIMLLANFAEKNYPVGLRMISRVIGYFQQNPAFTHAELPDLDPAVDKLSLDLLSLSAADCNHLFGMMGIKYLPAVFYKLRLLPFAGPAMQAEIRPMRAPSTGR